MKPIITALLALTFLAGCASAPSIPNGSYMVQEIMAGRMKADDVNKAWDDYYAARAEYEQSGSYKATMVAISPLLVLGAAANGMTPSCGYRAGVPSRATINTVPTGGGGWRTSVRWK